MVEGDTKGGHATAASGAEKPNYYYLKRLDTRSSLNSLDREECIPYSGIADNRKRS
jgi:hypothetical protein